MLDKLDDTCNHHGSDSSCCDSEDLGKSCSNSEVAFVVLEPPKSEVIGVKYQCRHVYVIIVQSLDLAESYMLKILSTSALQSLSLSCSA